MSLNLFRRWVYAGLIIIQVPLSAEVSGFIKIAAIRVEFQEDESPGTSGNGLFLTLPGESFCSDYTIDGPPHDKNYFKSQLKAVHNYYSQVSFEKFGINISESALFPEENLAAYKLDYSMNYYHPLGQEDQVERLGVELFRDAVMAAQKQDNLKLEDYDLVIVFHAGVGQDFTLPFLDPTPEDIVSAYIDEDMLTEYLGGPLAVGSALLRQGIILPETQNHLLYNESLFSELDSPCDFQYGLSGTLALMIGFSMGLPPLWETETGLSGIGIFGLMDQGSNNGRGVVPAPPDAWTRIWAGWEEPVVISSNSEITLTAAEQNAIIKIPINNNEYFLVENRSNWFRSGVNIDSARFSIWEKTGIYPPYLEILIDSADITRDENGIILEVSNYNLGLPASGLLIWHIDEQNIQRGLGSYAVNSDRDQRGIDLEEADGAQDIGYISNLIFDPSAGYFGDMWFRGNKEYERAHPEQRGEAPIFSNYTFPDTRSNNGADSKITISNISEAQEKMTFNVDFDLSSISAPGPKHEFLFLWDIDQDGEPEIFGGGDSLWWSEQDLEIIETFYKLEMEEYEVVVVQEYIKPAFVLMSQNQEQLEVFWFEFDQGIKQFNLLWSQKFNSPCGIGFIEAYAGQVNMTAGGILYSITEDLVSTSEITEENACGPGAIIYSSEINDIFTVRRSSEDISTSSGASYTGNFIDLALLDLELDGHVDILALDDQGNLWAFDKYLYLKSGFPVNISAVPPILGGDLLNDIHPEIIVKNDFGDILILNGDGLFLHRYADQDRNNLMMLGIYNQKQALISSDHITLFKNTADERGNYWQKKYGSPDNAREIFVQIISAGPDQSILINKDLTYAYPNPGYGQIVKLRIQVESAEKIKVNIYDSAGYHVKSIDLNNPRSGSVNEINWDISKCRPGIYFAHLKAVKGNLSTEEVIKIAVLK